MKRPQITSPTEQTRIMQGANRVIRPPSKLTRPARKHFDAIIAENAKAEWSDHATALAAQLATAMADLESENALLHREGRVVAGLHGPRLNPRADGIKKLVDTVLSYRRSLSLVAKDPRVAATRAAKALQIEAQAAPEDDLESLFNKPRLIHSREG